MREERERFISSDTCLAASHTRKFCISNSQATSSGEHDSGLFFIRLSHTPPQAVPIQFHLLLNWGLLLVSSNASNEAHRAFWAGSSLLPKRGSCLFLEEQFALNWILPVTKRWSWPLQNEDPACYQKRVLPIAKIDSCLFPKEDPVSCQKRILSDAKGGSCMISKKDPPVWCQKRILHDFKSGSCLLPKEDPDCFQKRILSVLQKSILPAA